MASIILNTPAGMTGRLPLKINISISSNAEIQTLYIFSARPEPKKTQVLKRFNHLNIILLTLYPGKIIRQASNGGLIP